MNIEHAKRIPMPEILSKLEIQPTNPGNKELCYSSPIRNEKTPSFFVNVKNNLWFDHGEGIGGDVVAFARLYLERQNEEHTVSDALRWLRNMSGIMPAIKSLPDRLQDQEPRESPLTLRSVNPIQHLGLVKYLEKRGIPLDLARQYLKELYVQNKQTGKSLFTLGFPNEDGGYELRNPFYKGCISPKAITFIRGSIPKPEGIHLFEGSTDYLSAIAQRNGKGFRDDTIVLNSVSCLKQALPYIHNYGYRFAYTWMDNDPAGKRATLALAEFFKTQATLSHVEMNKVYAPHKDVSAWHMHQLGLC
jgi:hypothetical protein